jgi:hypothetical protein
MPIHLPIMLPVNLPIEIQIVLFALGSMALFAAVDLMRATVRLKREEVKPLREIQSWQAPTTPAEALNALNRFPDSSAVQCLRLAVETGRMDLGSLPIFDRIHWARFFAGLFVFVGLVGTVAGISRSIAGLSDFSTDAPQRPGVAQTSGQASAQVMAQTSKLQTKVNELLAGIKTASTSTLWGLVATLVVAFFNARYLARCHAVEESASRAFRSYCEPVLQRTAIRSADDHISAMAAAIHRLGDITESLQTATHALRLTSERLTEKAVDSTAQIQDIMQGLRSASDTFVADMKRLKDERGETADLVRAFEKAAEKVGGESRTIREAIVGANQDNLRLNEAHRNQNELTLKQMRDMLRQFESVLKDVTAFWPESPLRKELQGLRSEFADKLRDLDHAITTRAGPQDAFDSSIQIWPTSKPMVPPLPHQPAYERTDGDVVADPANRTPSSMLTPLSPAPDPGIRTGRFELPDSARHPTDRPKIISAQRPESLFSRIRQSILRIFRRNRQP